MHVYLYTAGWYCFFSLSVNCSARYILRRQRCEEESSTLRFSSSESSFQTRWPRVSCRQKRRHRVSKTLSTSFRTLSRSTQLCEIDNANLPWLVGIRSIMLLSEVCTRAGHCCCRLINARICINYAVLCWPTQAFFQIECCAIWKSKSRYIMMSRWLTLLERRIITASIRELLVMYIYSKKFNVRVKDIGSGNSQSDIPRCTYSIAAKNKEQLK